MLNLKFELFCIKAEKQELGSTKSKETEVGRRGSLSVNRKTQGLRALHVRKFAREFGQEKTKESNSNSISKSMHFQPKNPKWIWIGAIPIQIFL